MTSNAPVTREPTALPVHSETVTWSIQSDPAGAEILRLSDEKVLGRTPWQVSQPSQQGIEEVKLRLSGYADRTISLDRGASSVVNERMEATQPATAAPTASQPDEGPIKRTVRKVGRKRSATLDSKSASEAKDKHGTFEPED